VFQTKCPNCGEKNQDEAKFCFNCGNSLIIKMINKMDPQKFSVSVPVYKERDNTSKVISTELFGITGLGVASGKKLYEQRYAYISTHENGVKIDFRKANTKNIKIEWDKIVDAKIKGVLTQEMLLYLIEGRPFKIKFGPIKELYKIVKEKMCGVIPENIEGDEGWN
jgi:hypothetical protein